MRKPMIALAMLCMSFIGLTQTSLNNPALGFLPIDELIIHKIAFDRNFIAELSASNQWNDINGHPSTLNFSAYSLPNASLNGLMLGGNAATASYGPFNKYEARLSIGAIKADSRFNSGFYFNIMPGYSGISINPSKINWYEAEPQQPSLNNNSALSLSWSGGSWFSFDHRRKILQYSILSHDVLDNNSNTIFNRIFGGMHAIRWTNILDESRTETEYILSTTTNGALSHQIAFRYFSPIHLYGGVGINTNANTDLMLGYQLNTIGQRNGLVDFQYTFNYSFASYGTLSGQGHHFSIRYLCEL